MHDCSIFLCGYLKIYIYINIEVVNIREEFGLNLHKGRRARSATKKVEYIWNDLRSTKAQKSV